MKLGIYGALLEHAALRVLARSIWAMGKIFGILCWLKRRGR